jgi:hypothetical protein
MLLIQLKCTDCTSGGKLMMLPILEKSGMKLHFSVFLKNYNMASGKFL